MSPILALSEGEIAALTAMRQLVGWLSRHLVLHPNTNAGSGMYFKRIQKINKKEGNENMIFLVELVMTLALANGRDAQSPLAVMRMWSSRPKGAFNQGLGQRLP